MVAFVDLKVSGADQQCWYTCTKQICLRFHQEKPIRQACCMLQDLYHDLSGTNAASEFRGDTDERHGGHSTMAQSDGAGGGPVSFAETAHGTRHARVHDVAAGARLIGSTAMSLAVLCVLALAPRTGELQRSGAERKPTCGLRTFLEGGRRVRTEEEGPVPDVPVHRPGSYCT